MSAPQQLSFTDAPATPRYSYAKQALAMVSKLGDGVWRSLAEMEREMGFKYAQTAISARIRDLRRGVPGFELWTAERDSVDGRNFYRIRRR